MDSARIDLAKTLAISFAVVTLACAQAETAEPVDTADQATDALPNYDILLGNLSVQDGRVQVTALKLVADHDGYDNQPHFSGDGRSLLYTSEHDGQTDIYRYDLVRKTTNPVVVTPEGEYSATWLPNGKGYSVIRQDADSLQRIWSFDADGSNPQLLLKDVHPVGYHAWGDEHTIAMFVLGDPITLQIADTKSGTVETVDTNIGRSLHKIPGRRAVSFVQKESDDRWVIKALDLTTDTIEELTVTRPGEEDYAWSPDGRILMGQGAVLYAWSSDGGWTQVADLSSGGFNEISRIAVSPDGSQVALVVR